MRRQNVLIILAVLLALCMVALPIATNVATGALPEDWQPFPSLAWSAFIVLVVLMVGFTVCQVVVAERPGAEALLSGVTDRDAFNRQRMIEKVRSDWIDGYLRRSLHDLARIELDLEEKADAVDHAWSLVVQQPGHASRPVRPGTSSAVFDQLGKALLILGDPGAGKTTLLLELTEVLLSRAEHDPAHPIPVVFNLATWTACEGPLAAWLVDELTYRYYVPRKLAQRWIDADQILPLLDGLDEVGSDRRDGCVEAVNLFREQHGQVPIVVCSRTGDYDALTSRLRLTGAVVIQPLLRPRVQSYLERAGPALAGLRAVLRADPALWELLGTPLMLSVAVLAYRGQDAMEIAAPGPAREWRACLWAAYIDAMFRRRAAASPYPPQQTIRWLVWLARMLARNGTPMFLIERIEPVWLRTRVQRWALRYGLAFFSGLPPAVYLGFCLWLAGGPKPGLISGFVFLLLWLLFRRDTARPAERLRWSWAAWRRGLPSAFVVALSVGASTWSVLLLIGRPEDGLGGAAFTTPITFILRMLLEGSQADEVLVRTVPNEGTRLSGRSGLLFGLGIAVVVVPLMLFSGRLTYGLPVQSPGILFFALTTAVVMAWTGFLIRGGGAYLQHCALRLLLWRDGVAPLNYPRFLDHAAERVLLYKVGGGYVFVHRLLMEHFAALDSGSAVPRDATVQA